MRGLFKRLAVLLAVMAFVLSPLSVIAIDVPDSIDGYYLDDANVISNETENYIHEKNWAMDGHCGGYIEVVTQEYINADILDYSVTLFNEWEIGSNNNGILLLVVTQEQKFYITVGRKLEAVLNSYRIEEIVNEYFIVPFEAGNYDKAIKDTFDALYKVLVSEYGKPVIVDTDTDSSSFMDMQTLAIIIGFILLLLFLYIVFKADYSNNSYNSGRISPRYHSYRSSGNSSVFTSQTSSFGRSSSPSRSSGFGGFRGSGSSSSRSGGSFSGRSSGGSTRGSGFGRR